VLSEKTTTCIGRAKSNDIVLDDVAVSAQHCRVRFEGTQFFLYDLQSTNGTFVNEQRVTRHQLRPGDLLKLGESFLQFKMERRKA
jgi:pSer/pThr/pTyr-binding forkhead associated (FHA) protein